MPRSRLPRDPQVVTWPRPDDKTAFCSWLATELQQAIDARSRYTSDGGYLDVWHALYEQAERPRGATPWPDAADLASYLPTEKVDALRARFSQVIFGPDPIATVEGWGEPSDRVAKVEAFHASMEPVLNTPDDELPMTHQRRPRHASMEPVLNTPDDRRARAADVADEMLQWSRC